MTTKLERGGVKGLSSPITMGGVFFAASLMDINSVADPDPYRLVGSGSVSNDTDPDPGIAPKTNQNHLKKIKIVRKYMMKKYLAFNIFIFLLKD